MVEIELSGQRSEQFEMIKSDIERELDGVPTNDEVVELLMERFRTD